MLPALSCADVVELAYTAVFKTAVLARELWVQAPPSALPKLSASARNVKTLIAFSALTNSERLLYYLLMMTEVQSGMNCEVCGVLIGDVYRDSAAPLLYISAVIRGDPATGSVSQVFVTPSPAQNVFPAYGEQGR